MWFLSIALRIPTAIFGSLARANERLHAHNVRDFPHAKLDSELNARFLFNEHGQLYFLLYNNSAPVILLKKQKRNFRKENKDTAESVHKTVTQGCKLWSWKRLDQGRFKWCNFFYMILFHFLKNFFKSSFPPSITLINCTSSYRWTF